MARIILLLSMLALLGCGQCYIHAAQYLSYDKQHYLSGRPALGSVQAEMENRAHSGVKYRLVKSAGRDTVKFWLSQGYRVVGVYPVGFGMYHAVVVDNLNYDESMVEWYVSFKLE